MSVRFRPFMVAVAVMALLGTSAALAQDRDDLAEARARLAEVAAELDEAVDEADGAALALDDAEARLAEVEAIVNQVAQRVEEQRQDVRSAEDRLDELRAQEAAAREAIRTQAIELYKRGYGGNLMTILEARDIETALERSALLQRVSASDQVAIETLVAATGNSEAARQALAAEQTVLDELLTDQRAVQDEAERLRGSRALAAAAAKDDVRRLEEEHDDLEAEEERIKQLIEEAEARARAEAEARKRAEQEAAAAATAAAEAAEAAEATAQTSSSSGSDRGSTSSAPQPRATGSGYSWPLCGPVTSEFGWRWGRQHRGIDLDDTRTNRITAAQSGVVIFAGWNSGGYGNLTLIRHADGVVTAYAHQSALHVRSGQSVSRGQHIGRVGNTGNSTGPHLHFETRVNGGNAVNPRNFLSGGGC